MILTPREAMGQKLGNRMGRRHHRLGLLAPVALASLLAACSDDGTGPAPPDTGRIVEGVDLDLLFADPTPDEIAAVSTEWEGRTPGAVDVEIEGDSVVTVDTLDVRVRIVSHTVDGLRHYGAVLVSAELVDPAPLIVYAHGGDEGTSVEDILLQFQLAGDLAASLVWVVPSFRSEDLSFGDATWTSEGAPSPWDRDVDDALSLLDVALDVESAADPERVGALGFSRGGAVALLMAIRDSRIDRVVEFFGPTDFFGSYVQVIWEEALRGFLRDLPGLAPLNDQFIQPLKRGDLTIAEVRPELIRRSAVLFAARLPAVQLHHGTLDDVVDVSQAESLIAAMDALGVPDFEAHLYSGGTHSPFTLSESIPRTVAFLSALLETEMPG